MIQWILDDRQRRDMHIQALHTASGGQETEPQHKQRVNWTHLLLHRLVLLVVWCEVYQDGALVGTVECQVGVGT